MSINKPINKVPIWISPVEHELFLQAVEVYLKHHPEHRGFKLGKHFFFNKMVEYYIES